jgi:outer membrane autotransporter protein
MVTLSPVSNFKPSGVSRSADATSVANYLTSAWNNADPGFGSVFATLYNKVPVGSTYTSLLDQLSPRATQVPVTALTNLSSMILGSAMSCPQFEDGTTRLGEGSCVWAKGNGQVTNEYGLGGTVTSSGYHIGGQGALGPNWRIGGAFGGGSIWASEGNGSKGSGQSYDGSVALKYTNGPWLFAGSLALANAAYSHNRVIDEPGVVDTVLQSNSEALLFGGRLRAAYNFGFNGWYLRPIGDLDLFYTHTPGFTESGNGTYALAVSATSKVNVALTPTLEIGSRLDLNRATTLRAYADIGMSLLPDNQRSVATRFASALLDDGTFSSTIKSPDVIGNLDFGLQLYHTSGFDVRAEYNLRGGDAFLSQGGTLRLGYRF